MSRRVLVTGGFGFLGGRAAVELAREPAWTVRLGSRKARPAPIWLPQSETVVMDVLSPNALQAAMVGVHAVVHLAAMPDIECVADPGKAVLTNTMGTLNVLQAAIAAGVERFLYVSTIHVYGTPLIGHISEATLPRPVYPYAITHHAAEDFVLSAHDQKKITGIVVRQANGFGVPTHPDVDCWMLLVNDLCCQAVRTRRMVLRSTGLQLRNFITMQDAGRGIKHLLELPQADCGNGLFNNGGNKSLSVLEMAQQVARQCQASLGFLPTLEHPVAKVDEQMPILDYDATKLRQTGFTLIGDPASEISRILHMASQFKA